MSAKNATPLTSRLRDATVDLLWRQWRAIGGAAAGGPVQSQVDLEVLCLGSLALDAYEPRLWITMADWIREGSALVSVQRMKNLVDEFPSAGARLPDLVHVAVNEARDARWRALTDRKPSRAAGASRLPVRRRTAGPAIQSGPALSLRMRAIFGIGVKADLMAFLIGSDARATVSAAAAALGYTTPPVFRALQDFQSAGLLMTAPGDGAAEYWVKPGPWGELFGGREFIAPWSHWLERVGYACAAIAWEAGLTRRTVSDYARAAGIRDVAAPRRRALARALGIHTTIPDSADLKAWSDFHDQLAHQMGDRPLGLTPSL